MTDDTPEPADERKYRVVTTLENGDVTETDNLTRDEALEAMQRIAATPQPWPIADIRIVGDRPTINRYLEIRPSKGPYRGPP